MSCSRWPGELGSYLPTRVGWPNISLNCAQSERSPRLIRTITAAIRIRPQVISFSDSEILVCIGWLIVYDPFRVVGLGYYHALGRKYVSARHELHLFIDKVGFDQAITVKFAVKGQFKQLFEVGGIDQLIDALNLLIVVTGKRCCWW